jgi:hypothetical protein
MALFVVVVPGTLNYLVQKPVGSETTFLFLVDCGFFVRIEHLVRARVPLPPMCPSIALQCQPIFPSRYRYDSCAHLIGDHREHDLPYY